MVKIPDKKYIRRSVLLLSLGAPSFLLPELRCKLSQRGEEEEEEGDDDEDGDGGHRDG